MFKRSLQMFFWMTLITGIAYPLLITLLAQLTMPFKAKGSLLVLHEKIVGSRLIGQKFELEKYFWGRPSAVDYNALSSGGSNLGPISLTLKNLVITRKKHLLETNGNGDAMPIPGDLLFASGSGLDPHISVEAALFQKNRIARTRGLNDSSKERFNEIIDELIEKRKKNFSGIPCVNVLELNLALDELKL
jgi:potassium-transporting ATPase KdpC subunit